MRAPARDSRRLSRCDDDLFARRMLPNTRTARARVRLFGPSILIRLAFNGATVSRKNENEQKPNSCATLALLIILALLLLAFVGGHARGLALGNKALYDIRNDFMNAITGSR